MSIYEIDISSMSVYELIKLLDLLKKRSCILDDANVSIDEINKYNKLFENVEKKIAILSKTV
jgi:hypothetical protein